MNNIKNWTGERLETFVYNENTVEHLHRYAIALDITKDKIVLDIASGEGYGTNLISKYAKKVFGVDIDEKSIEIAKQKYKASNIEFKVGSAEVIPLDDNSVDVVISFETLEHHNKHHEMMKEVKRVIKQNGILIISTPDKKNYSDAKNYKNPFHVKELYANEFKLLIDTYFSNSKFYFQNMFRGSLIIPEENNFNFENFEGDYDSINNKAEFAPMYIIAIASDKSLMLKNTLSSFDGNNIDYKQQQVLINNVRESTINSMQNSRIYRIVSTIIKSFKRIVN